MNYNKLRLLINKIVLDLSKVKRFFPNNIILFSIVIYNKF